MKIKTIIAAFILTLPFSLFAQQDNTLFFMHKVPQSNFANPAIQSECKLHIGGMILPVFGQLFAPIHVNYSNNAFNYSDVLFHGTGDYADSLISPFHPNALENGGLDDFMGKLRRNNYMTFDMQINLLNLGYKWKDFYFNFNISERADFRFGFSRDFFEFIAYGNENAYGRTLNMGWLGVNAKHYREYALGTSYKMSDKLNVGGKVKLLFGKANLQTVKNDIKLETDPVTWAWWLDTDMEFSTSSPFMNFTEFYYNYDSAEMVVETDTTIEVDPVAYVLNRKNFGVGIDLGGIYKLNDQISIHASIIDLGLIRWKTNPNTVTSEGTFTFGGIDINNWYDNQDVKYDSLIQDSLIRIFEPKHSGDPYNTFLTSKIYIGGTYQLHEKLSVGVLSRTEVFNKSLHSSIVISANSNITDWFSASLNYSIINNTFTNVGMGLYVRGSIFQFFFISDNILAPIMPHKTNNINFRMGSNWAFGCKKEEKKVMF